MKVNLPVPEADRDRRGSKRCFVLYWTGLVEDIKWP